MRKLDYFEDIIAFALYAQGVDSSMDIDALYPSYIVGKSRIEKILGADVYDKIKNEDNFTLQEVVKTALANYSMYEYLPFSNFKRDREKQMYKYQLDMAREQYLSCAWMAMDDLLQKLDKSDIEEWKKSKLFIERENLIIKDAQSFEYYYSINTSSLFYYKTLYLQREIINENLIPRLGKELLTNHADKAELIKRLLCYSVMARAVQSFDVAELPSNIRAKLSNEYSKDNSFELIREKLYQTIMEKVNQYYSALDSSLASNRGVGGIKNINKETHKFYIS